MYFTIKHSKVLFYKLLKEIKDVFFTYYILFLYHYNCVVTKLLLTFKPYYGVVTNFI